MLRGILVLVALCAVAQAQGRGARERETLEQKQTQRIRDLQRELRELATKSPTGHARPADQKRIFAEIAKISHPQAVRALAVYAEDPDYAAVREDLLRILAEIPGADETIVNRIMLAHIALDDPARRVARDYLLAQARRTRKDTWPAAFFYTGPSEGTIEDKFLSLQVMGHIESEHTLECAAKLTNDRSWTPDPTGLISCGTIATSVERFEGPEAARLLLLLTKDPRFGADDAIKMRDAMRTWRQTDLRAYVDLAALAHRDPAKRREAATFLGAIGLEAARAPLLRVAFDRREPPEVRAAAANALGGLRIAREDLAEQLKPLLSDPEKVVRAGAQEGLGRLQVRRAAEVLVSMLDGPFASEVDAVLSRLAGMPPGTDWRKWLRMAFPPPAPDSPDGPPRDGK